ncbi:MAG: hypothetical protein J5966_03395 [Lachnospiraceae bacterium]|nr:hypothetical protein [Lachnospiraceae bacterium]
MKNYTNDLRSGKLIKRMACDVFEFDDITVYCLKKSGKFAYYITLKGKETACFAFCSDAQEDIKELYNKGAFQDKKKRLEETK